MAPTSLRQGTRAGILSLSPRGDSPACCPDVRAAQSQLSSPRAVAMQSRLTSCQVAKIRMRPQTACLCAVTCADCGMSRVCPEMLVKNVCQDSTSVQVRAASSLHYFGLLTMDSIMPLTGESGSRGGICFTRFKFAPLALPDR